jgi:hypothetical protein
VKESSHADARPRRWAGETPIPRSSSPTARRIRAPRFASVIAASLWSGNDWRFDGDDLIAVSRPAYDDDSGEAHRLHDANYLTFHRFKNLRQLTDNDSVPVTSAPT